jgi:hypothetical protein
MLSGKPQEIFNSGILPHEGANLAIGGVECAILLPEFSTSKKIAVCLPVSIDDQPAFRVRSIIRWLSRDTGSLIKNQARSEEYSILILMPSESISAVESALVGRGAAVRSIELSSDIIADSITLCVGMLMSTLDEVDPSFRTSLSGETEMLSSSGVFNTAATGEVRDTLLLSSWCRYRFAGRLGSLPDLDLLDFSAMSPSTASPLVDGWVDELFGEIESFKSLDVLPAFDVVGDLLVSEDGQVNSGNGFATSINIGGFTLSRSGLISDPTSDLQLPRRMRGESISRPQFNTSGTVVVYTDVARVDLDHYDGIVVRVAANAPAITVEVFGSSFDQSRSGEDSFVGFFNPLTNEWEYTLSDGTQASSPALEEPYYSPDGSTVANRRVFRREQAYPCPTPAIRSIYVMLIFEGPVDPGFNLTIKQSILAVDIPNSLQNSTGLKWPMRYGPLGGDNLSTGYTINKVNFDSWIPEPSKTISCFRIETFNSTLWQVGREDEADEAALTQSFGSYRSINRSFFAYREFSI